MIYGSVCSGIEAATVAWHPLGWKAAFYSEIEKFPSAVLAHHYPAVRNLGDFTTIKADQHEPIDLLVGGTPCQSFSMAGLRGGLADDRGNLALEFLRLAHRARPRWLVWENVPGVLSSNGGRDFGAILGGMGELGYGVAYRVLDAQYVRVDGFWRAVPQRRRRVFVVGYLGDWRCAAAVLFERAGMLGDPPPGRDAGENAAGSFAGGAGGGGATRHVVAIQERAVSMNPNAGPDGVGARSDGAAYTLEARAGVQAVAFESRFVRNGRGAPEPICPPLKAQSGQTGKGDASPLTAYLQGLKWIVRRITPMECERLQGFPDGYTDIPWQQKNWTPDGPRYKSLGNSMAVNVMRWIGTRIEMVETLTASVQAA